MEFVLETISRGFRTLFCCFKYVKYSKGFWVQKKKSKRNAEKEVI